MINSNYIIAIQEIISWIIEQNLSGSLDASLMSISNSLIYSSPELLPERISEFFEILNFNIESLELIESELQNKLEKAKQKL